MNSRLLQVLLGLSLLLNTFVLMGFVYRSWIAPPFEMHRPPPPRGPSGQPGLPGQPGQPGGPRFNPVEMVTHDLDLDTEQRKVLQGLFDQYAKARRGRLAEIQRLREQTAVEMAGTPLDMSTPMRIISNSMVLMRLAAPKRRQICMLPDQSLTSRPCIQTITSVPASIPAC